MYRYPLNGRPSAFWRGDWYVGKGVASARIEVSKTELGIEVGDGEDDVQVVEVFNTHLHAPYEREPNDSYICHRTAQAWEIAKLMRGAAERGSLVLGMGDFNMLPLSFAHRVITAHAPVEDAWRVIYPESSLGPSTAEIEKKRGRGIPTVERSLNFDGHTCDSIANTWRWGKQRQKRQDRGENVHIGPELEDTRAKRLDYIFVGDGNSYLRNRRQKYSAITTSKTWNVTAVSVSMTQRHPTLKCSLSDHFAVTATLSFLPSDSRKCSNGAAVIDSHSEKATLSTPQESLYPAILSLINAYSSREHLHQSRRILHFHLSLLVSIGCWIATFWSPRNGVAFALNFVSTLALATGIVDGLIGLLFVGTEVRALKEFEWEVENEMKREEKGKIAV